MGKRKRAIKRLGWTMFGLFLALNVIANLHAYHFTHFKEPTAHKTSKPNKLTAFDKVKLLVTGVSLPRPVNHFPLPANNATPFKVPSMVQLDAWHLVPENQPPLTFPNFRSNNPLGTVILFHGYGGEKTSMMGKAREFLGLQYNVFLVDFMGAGASEGNATSIGFHEARQVKDCYLFVRDQLKEKNIFLFGTSMGSAAVLKSMHDYPSLMKPKGLILECPFGSMYKTVKARFKRMKIPTSLAAMLVFWGGAQNGYWAFSFSPENYAKSIASRTLLLSGGKDPYVSLEEIHSINTHLKLKGQSDVVIFPDAGHENYLLHYQKEWKEEVTAFLSDEIANQPVKNKSP